jgi:hypothetical protein
MSDAITFELFQNSDADAVAHLLNRNHFYIGEHKQVTGEDYLYVQNSRGMPFSIVAKKNNKIICMIAAYETSGQKVAQPHQIFMGTMLLDIKYRLSYSVLVGLYDRLIRETLARGYKEILTEVSPKNSSSLFILLKYGFVLLSDATDIYGYWTLHNYFPAIAEFLDAQDALPRIDAFFKNLPIVNKKEIQRSKTLIEGRYIECAFQSEGERLVLLIDTIDIKVAGIDYANHFKLYPQFPSKNTYLLLSQENSNRLDLSITMTDSEDDHRACEKLNFALAAGEQKVVAVSDSTTRMKVSYDRETYSLLPQYHLDRPIVDSATTEYPFGRCRAIFDHSTGFLVIDAVPGGDTLVRFLWPCASTPYKEGALVPRQKALEVSLQKNLIVAREITDTFTLTREFLIEDGLISIDTRLKRNSSDFVACPFSYIWAARPEKYILRSCDSQAEWNEPQIMTGADNFEDYVFWSIDDNDALMSSVETIFLDFAEFSFDIAVDKRSRSVVHFLNFGFFLPFNTEDSSEEQNIEHAEIYFNEGDSQ